MPSAPANTDESPTRFVGAPDPGGGGQPAPAPRSQRQDRGAGSVCPLTEKKQGREEDQAGAEGREGLGSWRGRLTTRDRELVGHLGLVRYLRTGQIAELMFPGRAQSVISARLGELAERHGNTRALLKRLWYVNREGKRVQVWALTGTGYALAEEKLGRLLRVPRHDVASQFLEHATGVNQLYVALARRPSQHVSAKPGRSSGTLAAAYAPLATAFRSIPREALEPSLPRV